MITVKNVEVTVHPKKRSARNRGRLIFYIGMSAIPLLQFAIFYVAVNFNSLLFAFQRYDYDVGAYLWAGTENFARMFREFATIEYFRYAFSNSFLLYGLTLVVGTSLALFFSYYIYKHAIGSVFFKVLLFLPSIISSLALITVFKYFTETGIPYYWERLFGEKILGLISNQNTLLGLMLFFNIWISFGVPVLMYAGAMSGISISVTESAKMDGANAFQEFIHITLPLIYPTLVTFIITGFAGIFTNQMSLFGFFAEMAEYRVYTIGYYLYIEVQGGTIADYPYLAAIGLSLTIVMVPITLLVKYLLEKLGPSM